MVVAIALHSEVLCSLTVRKRMREQVRPWTPTTVDTGPIKSSTVCRQRGCQTAPGSEFACCISDNLVGRAQKFEITNSKELHMFASILGDSGRRSCATQTSPCPRSAELVRSTG